MNATRWIGVALGIGALGVMGCAEAPAPAIAPPQPASEAPQAGYAPPGNAAAPAPPPPPSPAGASFDVSVHGGMPAKKSAGPMGEVAKERRAPSAEPSDRPGLGTQWGETRLSRISTVPFVRADPGQPFALASMYYNDEEGARAMSAAAGFRRTPAGMFTVANGLVSIGLREESRRFFTGFVSGGKNYVVGEAGRRYSIVVHNNTNFRVEVVLSVDGLDVLDGKAGSFAKRGYLIDPRGEIEVDGFRQSMDTVAAFRFGSVRGSYAGLKTGSTANVGVIGIALFNEQGTNPVPWTPEEVQRRQDANPFPGQFATPP